MKAKPMTAKAAQQWLKIVAAECLRLADGAQAVQSALAAEPLVGKVRVLALGKAAAAMWRGAALSLGPQIMAALVIAPESAAERDVVAGVVTPQWQIGAHPLPDARSLAAGEAAMTFVQSARAGESLLVLLSGGASALCEVLPDGVSLPALRELQTLLLASNFAIADINAVRQSLSRVKAGGLARCCASDVPIRQLILSDVPDDDITVVGSAPFIALASPQPDLSRPDLSQLPAPWPQWWQRHRRASTADLPRPAVKTTVIASNRSVRNALQRWAGQQGLPVVANQAFAGECSVVAATIAEQLRAGPPGLFLFGGECHLQLPAQPGRGGRNQQLALLLALALRDCPGVAVLTLASDGVDGQSDAAGALFVSDDWAKIPDVVSRAAAAITSASSYDCWQHLGGLLFTGATGRNIADLVLCWKSPTCFVEP